jgi:hypothetical protein
MAFLVKSRRSDAALSDKHTDMVLWWFAHQLRALCGAVTHLHLHHARFVLAELRGGVQGLFGEYDRSLKRSQVIRKRAA